MQTTYMYNITWPVIGSSAISIVSCQLLYRSLYTDFECGLLRKPKWNRGFTIGETGRQEMLIRPRHLIPLLVHFWPGVHVCQTFNLVFLIGVMKLITFCYLHLFMHKTQMIQHMQNSTFIILVVISSYIDSI